jgi:hypothetical protein
MLSLWNCIRVWVGTPAALWYHVQGQRDYEKMHGIVPGLSARYLIHDWFSIPVNRAYFEEDMYVRIPSLFRRTK